MEITYEWRGEFDNAALEALHAAGFGHPVAGTDWRTRLERHSLGWVCAWQDGTLVGFVNVVWDGGVHAFILDTVVAGHCRTKGVGSALVATAAEEARVRVAARRLRGRPASVLLRRLRVHSDGSGAARPLTPSAPARAPARRPSQLGPCNRQLTEPGPAHQPPHG